MRTNSYQLQQERMALKLAMANTIQRVPQELQPKQLNLYPPDNAYEFERWLKDNIKPQELIGKERVYLPILWTGYWCNNGYGTKDRARKVIQRFIDSLPRIKKYWSVVQYDDGPMVDFKDLDIKIFGMSGGRIDYPIPLLCQPHKYEFPGIKKDIFCSFVGGDTHPIRRELVKEFKGKKDCLVEIKKIPLKDYCEVLARSVFALCPRGYGRNSFRCQEGMHYGCIPIYISTIGDFVLPYNLEFSKFGLQFHSDEIRNIPSVLDSFSKQQILEKQSLIPEHYQNFFTYQSCKQNILNNV